MKDPERICKNCKFYEYETDIKSYVCDDPDGEYLGEPVRETEHCPDWEEKGDENSSGNITGCN